MAAWLVELSGILIFNTRQFYNHKLLHFYATKLFIVFILELKTNLITWTHFLTIFIVSFLYILANQTLSWGRVSLEPAVPL